MLVLLFGLVVSVIGLGIASKGRYKSLAAAALISIIAQTQYASYSFAQGVPQGFAGLGEASGDYQQVSPQTKLSFPADHQAHDGYRIEWWYVTANLTGPDGMSMGLQWTLFRNALAPNSQDTDDNNSWTDQTIWMAHAAVTTPQTHRSAERFARGAIGQAGVKAENFSAWIDHWELTNPSGSSLQTLNAKAQGDDFAYDVTLTADRQPVLQGVDGYSVKSENGQASHYYSQPFYEVTGTITLDGDDIDVTGKAWLDREWSSQFLSGQQTGWDWFSLHLGDGDKIMLFRLRGDEAGTPFYSGNYIKADGTTRQLARGGITITPRQQTRIDGRRVPTNWRVEIPELDLDINTRAVNRNAMMKTLFSYWEGPISFSGSHEGVGYLEMTGY